MHGFDFIQDLAVVMLIAGLAGWVCHRLGLSVVVGYLGAGMIVGPYTPPFSLVSNTQRIETLAQVGLVFLMFSIGMKLSVRKLRRLGGSLVLGTLVGAIIMYHLGRILGTALGWGQVQTAFLSAMLMVSSSSVISKVLQDTGATHERPGQMAMGISVMEDVVAVAMLTILNSLARVNGPGHGSVGETLGLLGAFVVATGIVALLVVPWLLRRLSVAGEQELMTILTAGVLFTLALLAQRAGFSLALGAFLIGTIVAETPQRTQVDRTFEGMRDLFSAVFFVAIGMLIDLRAALHLWWLVLLLGAVAIVGRAGAVTAGLLVTGSTVREAVGTGPLATPLGEFTFIIAQLGVAAGVLAPEIQAVAVGVALLTALAAPFLARGAPGWAAALDARQPSWMRSGIDQYHRWLDGLAVRRQRSSAWSLGRKRILQIAVEALLVTGLLAFSGPILAAVRPFLPGEGLVPGGASVVFWGLLTLAVLLPLVALWRNVSALAMIYAEFGTAHLAQGARLRPMVDTGLKLLAAAVIILWLGAIVPLQGMGRWVSLFVIVLAVGTVALLRSKLIYWHSVLQTELQERLADDGPGGRSASAAPFLSAHGEWRLGLAECTLPDLAACGGRTIGELGLRTRFGCVIAGIERQGVMIVNPPAATALFPRDRVLLLGEQAQTAAGKAFLAGVTGDAPASDFDEVRMETVELPARSMLAGWTLAELGPTRRCGVQVAGIRRSGHRIVNPSGDERLLAGDGVLVLGSPEQIAAFRAWANEGV